MHRQCKEVAVHLYQTKRNEKILKLRKVQDLAKNSDGDNQLINSVNLKKLAQDAADASNPMQQVNAVQTACQLISVKTNPPISALIKVDILPILVECLKQYKNVTIQFNAAWALSYIAAGSSERTNLVVANGAVPLLIDLLNSPNINVCTLACVALGNIIDDGSDMRDFAITNGIVEALLLMLSPNTPIPILRSVSSVLAKLCRQKDSPASAAVLHDILPALNVLIQLADSFIVAEAALAISHIAQCGSDQIQMVLESGSVPKLMPLLSNDEEIVQLNAVRAMASLVAGSQKQKQFVLNYNALLHFPPLLSHAKPYMRREALEFISHVTAGTQSQVQSLINADLVPKIIENLSNSEYPTQMVAIRSISNFIRTCDSDQILTLVNMSAIQTLCNLLAYQDTNVIEMVLGSLNQIFQTAHAHVVKITSFIKKCRGMEKIQLLQFHGKLEISMLAAKIIQEYFKK